MPSGFATLDYVVLGVYLVAVVVLGSLFVRGQKSIDDYFLAGRSMPWFAVCLSIIATDLSALSYMGAPAWAFEKDLKYGMGIFLFPLIMVLVVLLYVPIFFRLKLYTVYEYAERRFGVGVRSVASVLFLITRGVWLAGAIFTPSLALSVITGIPVLWCVIIVGVLSTFYTVMGGMKAVIWTDVAQFVVLVGGLVAIVAALLVEFGGDVGEIWRLASEKTTAVNTWLSARPGAGAVAHSHTTLFSFRFSLAEEATLWGVLALYLVGNLSSYGTDQVVVQRYFTLRTKREIAKAVIGNGLLVVPVCVGLYFAGIGFVAYYSRHPELLAALDAPNKVLPHFVVHVLPTGVRGLIIAGLFAATMSSVDSGINSLTTSTIVDFYRRFFHREDKSDRHYLWAARMLTIVWGAAATCFSIYFATRTDTILKMVGEITTLFGGAVAGIFLLGVLTRRANSPGTLIGAAVGLGLAAWLKWQWSAQVNWMWRAPVATLTVFVVGYLASLCFRRPAAGKTEGLTVLAPAQAD